MNRTSTHSVFRTVAIWLMCLAFPAIVQAGTISVAWDANPSPDGVTGYRVYIGTSPGNYTVTADVGNVLTYEYTNAQPGVRYYFSVRAYNSNGEGAYSAEVSGVSSDPELTNPGNQTWTINVARTLQLVATDPQSEPITFSAVNLPFGLTLNPSTGLISGTPTSAGTYSVIVTASAPTPTSVSFTWVVSAPDTTAPAIAIATPTAATTFLTRSTTLTIGGTASDAGGLSQVTWSSDRGGAGTAAGTGTWSANVPLAGGVNTITVTATDAAGNASTDSIAVTLDTTGPLVTISTPTSSATYATGAGTVTIGGTSSDASGVVQVAWSNSRGGSGTATGTTSWSAANIALQGGSNVITLTARDAAGNTGTGVLTVNVDTSAPVITLTSPTAATTYTTAYTTVTLTGTATDPAGISQVAWSNNRGGTGTATGTATWSATVPLQSGANVITLTARDGANNTATDVVTVTLDTSLPSQAADLLVRDTFVGATGSALAAHAPDVNTAGGPWALTGATPAPTLEAGAARIATGGGHLQATLPTATADVRLGVDYIVGTSAQQLAALVFRLTDANNFMLAMYYQNALHLYRRQAGTYVLLASSANLGAAPVGSVQRFEVRAVGTAVSGWWNGVQVVTTTDTVQTTATRHGLGWNSSYDTTARFDNFEVRRAATAPAAPATPGTASPANGATGVAIGAALTWSASGATSYDIAFGTSATPPAVATNVTSATYAPALAAGTTYYWQIIARNAGGTTTGPVWSFTTQSGPGQPSMPAPATTATGVAVGTALTWSASGATSYDIAFGTTATPPIVATNLASATYAPTLAAGTTYYWQVLARNSGGTTTGPVWSFTTAAAAAAPGAPAVTAPANGATGVTTGSALTWSASGATSYDIAFGTTATPSTVATNLANATYTPTLAAGTTYYWRVTARNATGTTAGPVWSFTTAAAAAASDLLVSDAFTGAAGSLLIAHAPDVNTPGGVWAISGAAPLPAVTLGAGAARIGSGGGHMQATLETGAADVSVSVDYVVGSGPQLAGVVGRFTDADNHLLLMWYLNRLHLYRKQGGTYTLLASSAALAPVPAGSTQRLELRADGNAVSGWWNGVQVVSGTDTVHSAATRHGLGWNSAFDATAAFDNLEVRSLGAVAPAPAPAPPAAPGTPSGPTPATGATGLTTGTTLGWSASGATSYDVAFGTTNSPAVVASGLTSASYAPTLAAGTTYYWQVTARNAGGSTAGPVWSFTTSSLVSAPDLPGNPSPAANATGVSLNATLTWVSSGATTYDVAFGTVQSPAVVASGLTSASYTPTLAPNTTYYWRVIARNSAGTTGSAVWSFTTAGASTGVLVSDTFTGSDGTPLTARVPDVNVSNSVWTITGVAPVPDPTLSGGNVRIAAGGGHMQATLLTSTENVRLAADYRVGTGQQLAGLVTRLRDADNHLLLMWYQNRLHIYRKQNGTYTLLASSSPLTPVAAGSTQRIEVRTSGSTVTGLWNGVQVVQATDTALQGFTRHGLGWNAAFDATAAFDNLEIRSN